MKTWDLVDIETGEIVLWGDDLAEALDMAIELGYRVVLNKRVPFEVRAYTVYVSTAKSFENWIR